MRIFPLILAASAIFAGPAVAAQPKAPAAKATAAGAPATRAAPANAGEQTPTEVQHALLYLRVLISGLQSDNVEEPVKGALVGCLYNNSLGTITSSVDTLITDNPGKVSRDQPTQVLSAILAVCGYQAETSDAAPSGRPAAPAAQPSAPAQGR